MSFSSSALLSSSMGLDDHDDHPRRFLHWQGEFLLAYGGDDGTLTMCVTTGTLPTDTSKSHPPPRRRRPKWIKVRQWDDAVRAIVIAPNGKRVAVGFETGATTIYTYDNYQHVPHEPHPFFKKAWLKGQRRLQEKENQAPNGNGEEDDEEEDDDDDDDDPGLLSQSSSSNLLNNGEEEEEHSFPGPPMSAPIRDLQFDPRCTSSSKSHYFLAIACEAGFCVTNVAASSTVLPLYLQEVGEKEHDSSGIRGLCYMKDSSSSTTSWFLTTLAMDGRLCVWNVTNCDDPDLDWELHHRDVSKCIAKPDVGELNGADAADRSCRPLVVSSSAFLALPGQTDVLLRPVSHVSHEKFLPSLDGKGHLEPIVAMTTQGPYLVTSGRDGRVNLWKLPTNNNNDKEDNATGTFVAQIGQYDSIPTDVCWMGEHKDQKRPPNSSVASSSMLYIACANGTCVVVPDLHQFLAKPNVMAEEDQEEESATTTKVTKNKTPKATSSKSRSEHITSPAPKKKNVYVDDEADDDEDDDGDVHVVQNGRGNDQELEDDDATVDLANALKASSTAAMNSHSSNRSITDEAREAAMDDGYGYDDDDDMDGILPHGNEYGDRHGAVALRLPEPQAAFAPSSTPLDLPRRILCWNHIGVISFLRGDDDLVRNMVNIEFTDVTQRRPMSFTDNMNFILGALGDEGAIFASDLQEEDVDDDDDLDADLIDGLHISERTKAMVKKSQRQRMKKDGANKSTGSSIYFHRFETFASLRDKDWYWSLPDGERVLGCACGEGWAAVATNRKFLRFFTLGGNQGQIIWLQGELVTMVGRSRFLAVFFHESNPLMDGTQQLGYALFDAVACRVISRGAVSSISKRSALSWAGFSNDFSLMVMDTDGMLSMLISMADTKGPADVMASSPWEWTPILDTVGLRKSTEDSIWPIAVQDGKLVCVPLKGGNQYPDATRRPVTATLSLRMPLARGGAVDKIVTLEELSVRANMALSQKRVISNYLISNPVEKEEFEDEYESMCAQVDKVTLQLYRAMAEAGKLERALDLVHRLHLEKSYDIAITMADRLNHRNLSDRIEEAKERWLLSMQNPEQLDDEEDDLVGMEEIPNDEEDEDGFDNNQYGTRESIRDVRGGKMTKAKPNTESATNGSIRRISPDAHRTVKKRSFDQTGDDQKNKNPFAKKRLESPAHKSNLVSSPPRLASPMPKISRASTFSTKSREQNKASKNFL